MSNTQNTLLTEIILRIFCTKYEISQKSLRLSTLFSAYSPFEYDKTFKRL